MKNLGLSVVLSKAIAPATGAMVSAAPVRTDYDDASQRTILEKIPNITRDLPALDDDNWDFEPTAGKRRTASSHNTPLKTNKSKASSKPRENPTAQHKTPYIVNYDNDVIFNSTWTTQKYMDSLSPYSKYPDTPYFNHYPTISYSSAVKVLSTIKDYTFKLRSNCVVATGWILDYEIPAPGKYPTKWFIAASGHFADNINFADTYGQPEPTDPNHQCTADFHLIKDVGTKFYSREVWHPDYPYKSSYPEWKRQMHTIAYNVGKPKLFYFPHDIFGTRYKKHPPNDTRKSEFYKAPYAKDFAVIEVDFPDEKTAHWITNNFYGKYHTQPNPKKRINFFSTRKESRQRGYLFGGHPTKNFDGNSFAVNYSFIHQKGSQVIRYSHQTKSWPLKLGPNHHSQWGHWIMLDNCYGSGGSGSMVLDEDLNLLGMINGNGGPHQMCLVDPIRWSGTYFQSSKKKSKVLLWPRHDLLLGAPGQRTSYMQQLEDKYPKLKTHLRLEWLKQKKNFSKEIK